MANPYTRYSPFESFAALLCLLFFFGCLLAGFYTLVLYAITIMTNWQSVVCG